jgi:hypothetical protein
MPNHEDVDPPEHQIRLSKGLIAKVVQSLELGSAIQAGAPAAQAAGLAPLSLTPGFVGDPTLTSLQDLGTHILTIGKSHLRGGFLFSAICDWTCIYS